jgi:hypothetical protein
MGLAIRSSIVGIIWWALVGYRPDGGQGATFRFSVPTDVTQSSADCRSFNARE